MNPLYFQTSEKNSFDWQTQHEQIRSKIISVLTNKPVLIIFDHQFPIELHTDASSIGYGAVLLHRINSSSRATSQCGSRYTSYTPLGLIPISDTEDEIDKIKSRELATKNCNELILYVCSLRDSCG